MILAAGAIPMTASLLLAERHKLLRDALRGLVETQRPDINIPDAGTIEQLQEHLHSCPEVDLLLIDRNMFESHDHFAISNVKAQAPRIRVVVLAERANDRLNQDALGADGLIHWDLSGRVMMKALDIVLSGKRYMPVLGMGALPAPVKAPSYQLPQQRERMDPLQRLTPRVRDVLNLLVKGHSNREIANRLSVKDITVSFHLKGLFRKLDAINRTQAATNALRLGWAA